MATAFVQGLAPAFGGAATSFAASYNSPNAAGNCLIVQAAGVGSAGLTISDTLGNNWVNIFIDSTTGSTTNTSAAWYALNCKGGANTVTVSWTTSTSASAIALTEYSGVALTNAVDKSNGNINQGPSTVWNTPTLSTTGNNELLVAFINSRQGTIVTSAPFTQRESTISSGTCYSAISDNVNQPIGSYSASGTQSNGGNDNAWLITFFAFSSSAAATGPFGTEETEQIVKTETSMVY